VIIHSETDDRGSRMVEVHIGDEGELVISGQDLGPAVSEFWGGGCTEYEFAHTIKREDLSVFLEALGAASDDDVIEVLRQKYLNPAFLLRSYLEPETSVPFTFWSRLGD
jgi:hypothetical protein